MGLKPQCIGFPGKTCVGAVIAEQLLKAAHRSRGPTMPPTRVSATPCSPSAAPLTKTYLSALAQEPTIMPEVGLTTLS